MPAIHLYICRGFSEKTAGESHRLLQKAAEAHCAGIGRSLPDLTLDRAEGGKPCFLHAPELHFSVSHSGGIWVCAFSAAPVGIDLQQIKPIREGGIARRFFHPEEIAYLDAHPDAFFALWTAKESYVKLTGQGVAAGFSRVSVISCGEFTPPPPACAMVHIPFDEGYALCLCGDTAEFILHELLP
ncbi:MAG: 4'-phosphopantetheinyl transferase superfamily protein [Ruminococcaceae bacterium]|nr:4'-phosphopantetheinyl transferase superfamily protein [Oscillospiraceae bacterium]